MQMIQPGASSSHILLNYYTILYYTVILYILYYTNDTARFLLEPVGERAHLLRAVAEPPQVLLPLGEVFLRTKCGGEERVLREHVGVV